MIEYRIIAQRIGLIGLTNLFSNLGSILLVPILTKNMSASDYGIWAQVNVTISLLSILLLFGLPDTMLRFLSPVKDKEMIKEDFYSILIVVFLASFLSSIIMFLFSSQIAELLFNDDMQIMGILPILLFVMPLNSLLFNYFRTFEQIKKYSLFAIISNCLNIILIIYFVSYGYGIFGTVLGYMISQYILFSVMMLLVISGIGIKMPRFTNIKKFLNYGLPIVPQGFASWALNSSDRYLISIFLGTAYVAYYSPGYLLGNMIYMMSLPIAFILPALLSRYYDSNELAKVEFVLSYSLKYFLALAIPSAIGLSLLSKPILQVLSTPQIAMHGYIITPFAALSYLLLGVLTIMSNSLFLKKKTQISSSIWMIAAALNVALNIVIIPHWGIVGAAATTLVSFFLIFILIADFTFKHLKFPIDYAFLMKSIMASAAMSIAILALNPASLLQIIAVIGISAVIYLIVLFILRGFDKDEISFFRQAFYRS
jgi:O-antigen/teichoic acid export membrane protein